MNTNSKRQMAPVKIGDEVQEIQNYRHTYKVTEVDTDRLSIRMEDTVTGTTARVSFGGFARFFVRFFVLA